MGESRRVGVVRALFRYPVKSMRGEEVAETRVGWHGFPGDRRYAFVRTQNLSGFPWLTARQVAELLLYVPSFVDPLRPASSPVRVRTPEGDEWAIEHEELRASIARRYAHPFTLQRFAIGAFDDAPISLITSGTLRTLGAALGMELQPRRFRPNIFVETPFGDAVPEKQWVGHVLAFDDDEGETGPLVRVSEQDSRCKMISLDPESAATDSRVLAEVVHAHDECAGVYGLPQRLGTLRVGQGVWLLEP